MAGVIRDWWVRVLGTKDSVSLKLIFLVLLIIIFALTQEKDCACLCIVILSVIHFGFLHILFSAAFLDLKP